jgi:hypothetical protein
MLFQLKNHKDNTVKAYSNANELRVAVVGITGDVEEGKSVLEWASTPAFGSYRYDHNDFEIEIIGQSDFYA